MLEPGARPRFEVDRQKMLELVRGANLYSGPQDALREIVQNSIDATVLRYAYDALSHGAPQPKSPHELRDALQNRCIRISITRTPAQPQNQAD